MKPAVLYLSDLDGTLLNQDAALRSGDAVRINRLTARGVRISYSTARTVRSVSRILGEIDFTLPGAAPVSLMNGTMIRSMAEGRYVFYRAIARESAAAVLRIAEELGTDAFVYLLDAAHPVAGDGLVTGYRRIANDFMRGFLAERTERYAKPFFTYSRAEELPGEAVYFCAMDTEENARRLEAALAGVPGIRITVYPGKYTPGLWYLEISPGEVSKAEAARFLRAWTGADLVVAFGDNFNDLPMFETADIAVAASGASDAVKAAADDVTDDVVGWIERHAGVHEG